MNYENIIVLDNGKYEGNFQCDNNYPNTICRKFKQDNFYTITLSNEYGLIVSLLIGYFPMAPKNIKITIEK